MQLNPKLKKNFYLFLLSIFLLFIFLFVVNFSLLAQFFTRKNTKKNSFKF